MRLTAITFDGFESGHTDFSEVFNSPAAGVQREQFLGVIERIADGIIQADENRQATSIIVVGHSDRQDRADMNCDQRRASEIDASQKRAISAWELTKLAVVQRLAAADPPIDGTDWWENAPHVTWGLVFAAAGMMQKNPPASEEERKMNRRVVFLVSMMTL
jgi:flagellar motor protein MotB